jgi:molybdopterin-guanine dinucleotide biosynthesis protein A
VIEYGVIILAGGQATRLPHKLELAAGEVPMLVRVYRNVSGAHTTYISCSGAFPVDLDAQLPCPMVIDRWTVRGPLSGILSTMSEMNERFAFVVAGDAPHISAPFIDFLAASHQPGDEAIVPRHPHGIEPLAALYDRVAFLREGLPLLLAGDGAPRRVIERLKTRYIELDDPAMFASVNTPDDYAKLREEFA